ncbi:Cytochrome P450 [Sphingobium faniae]|nr:Cytochrome P450 [Sphingobium faniae]
MSDGTLAPRPAHVPEHLVVDWDFTRPPGGEENLNAAWKQLHDGPDIIWTPRNGGHWIATRAADIEHIQKNHDPFSMQRIVLPDDNQRPRLLPIEMDPPEHARYRSILNQFFTPRAIKSLQEEARLLAIDLIDGFKATGRCEFISDFSMKLPITIFMKMVDQPLDDLDQLLEWTEMTVRPKKLEDRTRAHLAMNDYMVGIIEARRTRPGEDLLSAVVSAQVGGDAIPLPDLLSITSNLMFGGLDTVASSLGFAAKYLAENPAKRRELVDRPELIANAVDELLRMFAPSSTARVIIRDIEHGGVSFKAGDRIYIRPLLHGMDERKFPDPMEADWERPALERNYAAFGNGPHRCPGATLARSEMRIFLEEWLARIPDFTLAPDDRPTFGAGMVNAVLRLPLVWDPASVR